MLKFLGNLFSFILGASFNALVFIAIAYFAYTFAIRGFEWGEEFSSVLTAERENQDVEFVLDENATVSEVAQLLEDEGIIESALMFRVELLLMGAPEYYEAGTYVLNYSLSTTQLNVRLSSGPIDPDASNRITIPEGFTQRDIGLRLEDAGFFTAEEFMYTANNHDFGFRFLEDIPNRPSRLEGYLFPDTYFLPPNATPEQVITMMLSRFNEVFTFEYRMRADEMGLTMDQVVNIAAMVEREVRVATERPMVSRVIHNRLDVNMPLQIDATVIYALDRHLARITHADLEVDSPYNTYRVSGLPLGPISNPGAASINAALFPADGNWLFYVLVDADTGAHFFTDNYEDHLHAAATYMPRPWDAED